MGFDYFQGYYFCKPDIIRGTTAPTNKVSVFRLLAKLREPDVNPRDLERIVAEDLSLSYKLLRDINSACMGLKRQIDSVGHAVRMVGTEHIRMLTSLMMLTNMEDKPRELLIVSLIRAKMCELLAMRLGVGNKEAFFTVGLFSTLDAYLDCPMNDALDTLPLSDEIRKALLQFEGPLGEVLKCVLSFEQTPDDPQRMKLDSNSVRHAYVESLCWGETLLGGMAA